MRVPTGQPGSTPRSTTMRSGSAPSRMNSIGQTNDSELGDFRGRVLRASKKNFQLVAVPLALRDEAATYTADHASAPALLFGKVTKDRYSLDFSPGCLGPMQAFAIALSTFASKIAVA